MDYLIISLSFWIWENQFFQTLSSWCRWPICNFPRFWSVKVHISISSFLCSHLCTYPAPWICSSHSVEVLQGNKTTVERIGTVCSGHIPKVISVFRSIVFIFYHLGWSEIILYCLEFILLHMAMWLTGKQNENLRGFTLMFQ